MVQTDNKVQSAYQDEQEKIDNEAKQRIELSMRMSALLDEYGYDIETKLVNDEPQLKFTKRM